MTDAERLDLVRDARAVADRLNEKQSEFSFEFFRTDLLQGVKGEERRGYSLEQYYSVLTAGRAQWHCTYIVAISSEVLASGSFNREDPDRGCGVITVRDYLKFVPPGLSRTSYIAYLLLCVALVLKYEAVREHARREYCLFDLCEDENDLIRCLRKPHIDDDCRDKLQEAGVSQRELRSFEGILKDIGQREPYELIAGQYGIAAVTFFAGIVVALISAVVATEWPRIGLLIGTEFVVTILWLAGVRAGFRIRIARHHKRALWRISIILYIALLLACVFVVTIRNLPPLPSDPHVQKAKESVMVLNK